VNHADANKLQRLKLEIYRIAVLAICDLQRFSLDEGNRKAVDALRAIQYLTEE
jgi:hypothetical protein